jgi:hypothetical protein
MKKKRLKLEKEEPGVWSKLKGGFKYYLEITPPGWAMLHLTIWGGAIGYALGGFLVLFGPGLYRSAYNTIFPPPTVQAVGSDAYYNLIVHNQKMFIAFERWRYQLVKEDQEKRKKKTK